jgi:hypothetical protein
VRRLLAALSVVVAGCSSSSPTAPLPAPPPELAIIRASAGGYAVLETPTGRLRASLPAGILALGLSGGGDVAEAYLVTPTAANGTAIARVVPDRSFDLEPLATQAGAATAAVLAGAPGLNSFVGPPTVLAVLTADGRLFGYQHGSLLWWVTAPGGQQLVGVGDETLLLGPRGWQRVLLEAGGLGLVETAPGCLPGPVAVIAGQVVYDCGGRLSRSDLAVPSGRPMAFAAGGVEVLAFPNGELWRVDGTGARRTGSTSAWTVPPVSSPDGSLLYVVSSEGIQVADSVSGSQRALAKAAGITSVATSRDGNYVYVLVGGQLRTYAASGRETGSVAAHGQAILQVAGG